LSIGNFKKIKKFFPGERAADFGPHFTSWGIFDTIYNTIKEQTAVHGRESNGKPF
jgi:hypothetical protein